MKKDLTVFVLTTGEENLELCLSHLNNQFFTQKIDFDVQVIDKVYPMSTAFNCMIDRSNSDYYIQIDADILLFNNTIEILYRAAKKMPFYYYNVGGPLYEEGFGVGGSIRCWRREWVRRFRYQDCRTVDRNLQNRMKKWGLRSKALKVILGTHVARSSPFLDYLKTKSDVEKWRFLNRPFSMYAEKNWDKLRDSFNPYQALGFILGCCTNRSRVNMSKDTSYEKQRIEVLLKKVGVNRIEDFNLSSIQSLYNTLDKAILEKSYQFDSVSRDELLSELLNSLNLKNLNSNQDREFLVI